MDITKKVAKFLFNYHATMLDVCNVLNQIGILNNEKAEKLMGEHCMKSLSALDRMGYKVWEYIQKEGS